jgi:hypothetical protein
MRGFVLSDPSGAHGEPLSPGQKSGPGWDRTSDLPRVKLKRCRKRAVIAGRTGRTGPSLRVRTTQSERHGGCTADEIAPVTRRHGCGVPSARRRGVPLSTTALLPRASRCRSKGRPDTTTLPLPPASAIGPGVGIGPTRRFGREWAHRRVLSAHEHRQAGVLTTRHCNRSGKPGHHELRPLV